MVQLITISTSLICLQFEENTDKGPKPKLMDLDKVRTTLKQFMREWSEQVRTPLIPHYGWSG